MKVNTFNVVFVKEYMEKVLKEIDMPIDELAGIIDNYYWKSEQCEKFDNAKKLKD